GLAREQQIPYAVAEALPAALELRPRPTMIHGPLPRTLTVPVAGCSRQYFHHLQGIRLPVRRQVQHTTGAQLLPQGFHEIRLDEAALVVLLLVPGVGKEDLDAIEAGVGDGLLEHVLGICLVDA